jgi:hypothetical protein
MTATIQLGLLGEDEVTSELNTTLIESAEDFESFWSNVCGKSDKQIAYDAANEALDAYLPVWAKAQDDFYYKQTISKAEFLAAKAIYTKLDAEYNTAYNAF